MSQAQRILEADRQAQWRERQEQGGPRRQYETRWVIEKMRPYLPPEHVTLAYLIRDLCARSRGLRIITSERVDNGNGAEAALLSRLDAGRKLAGYDGAVRARLDAAGGRCLTCVAEEYTLAQTISACGYAAGSHRSVRQLVQLTMLAAQDYQDECQRQIEQWRAL